jgi:hypothetical protein
MQEFVVMLGLVASFQTKVRELSPKVHHQGNDITVFQTQTIFRPKKNCEV